MLTLIMIRVCVTCGRPVKLLYGVGDVNKADRTHRLTITNSRREEHKYLMILSTLFQIIQGVVVVVVVVGNDGLSTNGMRHLTCLPLHVSSLGLRELETSTTQYHTETFGAGPPNNKVAVVVECERGTE
ncbi:hypothetical protein BGW80DRAFT_1251172 [Lactifluus volemus]|nr:hypothetical protein BGW80DRAFT_1251172 [Lactifluus volemus]